MPLHVSSTRAHRQEAKIVLYNLWYHHTYRWPPGAQVERGLSPLSTCAPVLFSERQFLLNIKPTISSPTPSLFQSFMFMSCTHGWCEEKYDPKHCGSVAAPVRIAAVTKVEDRTFDMRSSEA